VADLINNNLAPRVVGEDAMEVEHIYAKMYQLQGRTHHAGWAMWCAMSGVDMAIWDVRGKALKQPVWRLMGGSRRKIRAYAGGISLSYQPPESLAEEAQGYVARGYTALKLRLGDTVENDLARVRQVRKVLGDGVDIMIDVNTKYSMQQMLRLAPGLEECNVYWIEEPFPPDALRDYALLAPQTRIPLAGGENHFLRYQARELLEQNAVQILQMDASKCGGISELKKIADLAAAFRRPIAPHTSMSAVNTAATLAVLSSCTNGLIYEGDVSRVNPFRDELVSPAPDIDKDGYIQANDAPGLGIEIDESLIARFPAIPGPAYG
jgi:L-alanine-DL-glutamate epimerase-like enolase superfamily enzyme